MGSRDDRDGRDGRRDRDRDRGPKKPWQRYSVELSGSSGERLWLTKDGDVAWRNSDVKPEWGGEYGIQSWENRMATGSSAQKLNKYLERNPEYSLKGGKGASVVGYRPINIESKERFSVGMGSGGSMDSVPGSREYVAIYGPSGKGGKGDSGYERPGGGSGRGGESAAGEAYYGGTDAANDAINSGIFDAPGRPTYGEEFLADYINAPPDMGPDPNAPIMQPREPISPLADGYPRDDEYSSGDSDVADATANSWQFTPVSMTEEDDEMSRTFAASAAFRDQLNQMAIS